MARLLTVALPALCEWGCQRWPSHFAKVALVPGSRTPLSKVLPCFVDYNGAVVKEVPLLSVELGWRTKGRPSSLKLKSRAPTVPLYDNLQLILIITHPVGERHVFIVVNTELSVVSGMKGLTESSYTLDGYSWRNTWLRKSVLFGYYQTTRCETRWRRIGISAHNFTISWILDARLFVGSRLHYNGSFKQIQPRRHHATLAMFPVLDDDNEWHPAE